jgi:phosphoribosylamine-glycine ligase
MAGTSRRIIVISRGCNGTDNALVVVLVDRRLIKLTPARKRARPFRDGQGVMTGGGMIRKAESRDQTLS